MSGLCTDLDLTHYVTRIFEASLDRATDSVRLEPDWYLILEICDLIQYGDVEPKILVAAIKKKTANKDPHVVLHSLLVLESCIQNCGTLIRDRIYTQQFMEQLEELVNTSSPKYMMFKKWIQTWVHTYRIRPKYAVLEDMVDVIQTQGYKFSSVKGNNRMFSADTLPNWVDGNECHGCRAGFELILKQHCRACGQVFCDDCTNTKSAVPKFRIKKKVRVCLPCYGQLNNASQAQVTDNNWPARYLYSSFDQQQVQLQKTAMELQEEEDLNLTVALIHSELKPKGKKKERVNSALKLNTSTIPGTTYSPLPAPWPGPSKLQEEKIDKLAKKGDRVFETSNISIHSFTDETEPSVQATMDSQLPTMSELLQLIKGLSDKVDKLERDQRTLFRCKSCRQSQSSNSSNSLGGNNLCFYHTNFGDKANKCVILCPQYKTWQARLQSK